MKISKTLIILLILAFVYAANEGDPCATDSDCQSLNSCIKKKCVHKELFPIRVSEVFASLWVALLNSISSAAGLAFGGSTVPYFQIFMHYSQSNAISLAYLITFGGGLGNLSSIMRLRHKETGGPIIHYNIALIAVPALTLGSQIGVTIRRVIPNFVQAIILLALLLYGTYNYWKKFRSQYKCEQKKFRKIKEDQEKIKNEVAKRAIGQNFQPVPLESERTETVSKEVQTPAKDEKDECFKKASPLEIEVKTDAQDTNDSHDAAWHARRNFLLKRELQLIPWYKLKEILVIVILIFLLVIIRGGKGVSSVAGITYCSDMDFGMLGIQLAAYLVCLIRNVFLIQRWENEKNEYNIPTHPDFIRLQGKKLIRLTFMCVFAGIVGAIASLGGGTVIIPELFKMGLNPMITAYSAGAFTLFTTFNSAVQTYFTGTIVGTQIAWFACLAFVFSSISARFFAWLFKKTGRQAFLPGIIFLVFVAAFVATLILLIIDCVNNWDRVIAAKVMC